MDSALVYKSNALIEASYRLSVYEQRIILACIAQVRRDSPLSDQQLYAVSAQQIANMTGTQLGTVYQNLKTAAERLFERRLTLHEAPNSKSGRKERLTRWVQTVEYREAEGTVALRFGTDMVPYLSQLTEQFTRYALADIASMESAYAIRLYELLCQWRDAGEREVTIEWLRKAFQLESKYPAIKDLKRWVIEPAVKQINEHSPLWVKWEQRKTGRRVTHLTFIFGEKVSKSSQKTVRKKTNGNAHVQGKGGSGAIYGISRSVIEANARVGESYEDAALRLLEESKHSAR